MDREPKRMKKRNKQINSNLREERNSKKLRGRILSIIQVVLIIIMIISIVKIYLWWKDNMQTGEMLDKILDNVTIESGKDKYTVDFKQLKEINKDIIGWLKVEETQIEYPVVKGDDNDFYLTHSFDKSKNTAGWVFMDYRNNIGSKSQNIVIYGHNRRDGSMFGTLKKILDRDWYDNDDNRYVTFITENGNYKYEVFSIYRIEKEDYYTKTSFTKKEFEEFIKKIKSRSIKDFKNDVNTEDEILTLSTCADDNRYRVVLHAKKVTDNK